jgi:glutamine amidotransferase
LKRSITIVDYGVGNLASVANMIGRAGGNASIESDPDRIAKADQLLLPGVGAFDTCRSALRARPGLEEATRARIRDGAPLLGICVGMQLLADTSEEGELPGLGLIPGNVRRFHFSEHPDRQNLRIPHMGWSIVRPQKTALLFTSFGQEPARFYFVHSYHFVCDTPEDIAGEANYGGPFTAAVQRDNVFGVQFHPEKSHAFGMRLLKRFMEL